MMLIPKIEIIGSEFGINDVLSGAPTIYYRVRGRFCGEIVVYIARIPSEFVGRTDHIDTTRFDRDALSQFERMRRFWWIKIPWMRMKRYVKRMLHDHQ